MPDPLTIKLQKELEKRGKTASLTQIDSILEDNNLKKSYSGAPTNDTVWDMLNTGRADELFAGVEQPGEGDFSPTRMAGVALWNFLEVGSLGLIPGLLDPKDILEKKAMPQNFSERVAASLGGLAGFLPTFGAARGIAKGAVAKFAPKGIGNISKSIKAKTVSTLKNDDAVKKYWNEYAKTNNIQVGGKEYTKEFDKFVGTLVDYPTAKLTTLNSKVGAQVLGTEKGRAEFLKSLQDNVPGAVENALKKHADLLKVPGLSKKLSDGLLEEAFNISSKSIKNYKLPTLNLQNVLADKWGNGRLANLGASALEEAILFSAVEGPMNIIQSALEDDVQLDLYGTLSHSFLLGSALGLFRYIPGGKGIPITSTVFNRVKKAAGKKRRYSRYDTSIAADRLALGTHLKTIASSRKDITKTLRKHVEEGEIGGVGTKLFSSGDKVGKRINKLVETPEGAAQVQKLLVSLEDAFVKKWWPGFLKEVPGDIIGSLGRMTAVALAFNYTTYKQWLEDGSVPLEDILFHTGLAAVLGKRGKQLTYSIDGVHHISEKNRPYQYSEDFKKVDEFLNAIQVNPQSSLFTAMMNDYNAINTSLTQIDLKSNDMKMFLEIAGGKVKGGVNIIVSEEGFGDRKPAKGKTPNDVDEVYDNYAAIIQGQFLEPGQRVLESNMLTNNQIKKVKKQLMEHEFEGLKEFRSEGQTAKGIVSTMDLYNVALESSAVKHRMILSEYKSAVIDTYNAIYEHLGDPYRVTDVGGEPIKVKKIIFGTPDESQPSASSRMSGFENAINLLINRGEVKYAGGVRDAITVDKNIQDIILGRRTHDKEGGVEVESQGILDNYEDRLTKLIMGDAQHDITRKIIVGDDIIDNSLQTIIFRDNVRETWSHLKYLMGGKYDSTKPYFKKILDNKDKLEAFSKEFQDIFYKKGTLATDIILTKGKGFEQTILDQEKMTNQERKAQEFVRSVLFALRMDVNGKRVGGGHGIKHDKKVNVGNVLKIYKEFRKANITGFHLPTTELRQDFAAHLKEYAFESSMASMVKNDGTPLTVNDRAVLGVMLESNILSSKYTIPDLKGFIENVENLDGLGNALKNVAQFKTLVQSMEATGGRKLSQETRIFIEHINEAAKSAKISPVQFLKDLKADWEETIQPYMKVEGKGGFINTSRTKGVVAARHLTEVMELIKQVKEINMQTSHKQLMDATEAAQKRLGSESIDTLKSKFINQVLTTLHGKYGDSHRALQLFRQVGLFKDGFFRFSEWFEKNKKVKPADMLRALEQRLAFNFNESFNETAYERLHKLNTENIKEISDLTKGVSKSLDGFLKDYGIEVSLQPGETASKLFRNDPEMEKAEGFVTNMIERATIKFSVDGKEAEFVGVDGFIKLGDERNGLQKQLQFVQEAVNVFGTLKHGKQVQRIHSRQGTAPAYTKDIVKESPLTDFFDKLGLDLSLIDTKIELGGNKVSNIMHERNDAIITDFYKSIAVASPVSRKGLGTAEEVMEDVSDNLNQLRVPGEGVTGHYVAWLGNFNSGIAIPIKQSSFVARKFYDLMEKKIAEWKDSNRHKEESYRAVIRKYNEFIKQTMDVTKDENGKVLKVVYKDMGIEAPQRSSEDMSVMMTTLFGHETMGENYWKAAVENFQDGSKFAHEVLRRFKLLTNRAHTKLSKDFTSDMINFYENNKFVRESPAFKDLIEKTLPVMKDLKKNGISFHAIRDELLDGKMPKVTSVLNQYNIQLQSEINDNPKLKDSFKDLKEEDGVFTFGEGNDMLGDASQVNSVNIVSKSTMEAIKAFLGFAHKKNILHGKPIGAKTSTGETVMIDKTAFIVDKSWSKYLNKNKINGVMFTSALKTLGNKYQDKIIDFKEGETIETFMKGKNEGKEIRFNLEDFSFGSLVKDKKNATVSLQVGSDLIGESANNAFYNWLVSPKVKKYYETIQPYSGKSTVERETFVRDLFGEMYEKTGGNQTASLMETWMGKQGVQGGLPTFFPFKRSITNSIKKMYIDKSGIFSPNNANGSQSVMAPSYFSSLEDGHLRNSIFHYDPVTGERTQYTVGEIQIDNINYHKTVNRDNLHIIKSNKYGKDEILTWSDFAEELGLTKYEKKFFFGQKMDGNGRTLGSIHQFLQLLNSRKSKDIYTSIKRVSYTDTLARKKLTAPNLENAAMAVLKSNKRDPVTGERDNKYIFLRSQLDVDKLENVDKTIEKDTKAGKRVKGGRYYGIDIVGDYYKFTDKMVQDNIKGKDIIIVDDILDAQSQMDAYKRSKAKHIYKVEWNEKFKDQLESAEVKLEDGIKYQVELVSSRNPSTRSSDKVIVALKGFGLQGNQARVNSIDSLTRMESDFDIDKVNYWWDTPTEVLREWESMQGNVAAVKPKSNPVSVQNLNFLDGNSLGTYLKDTERASLLKGIYVKSRRVVQWLSHYKGTENDFSGMSFQSFDNKKKTVGIDQSALKVIEKTIARDIQTILDSQKGWDIETYDEKYMDKILFGDADNLTDYPGIFVRRNKVKVRDIDPKTKKETESEEWSNDLENIRVGTIDADVISQMQTPYNRILRLTSGLYESGARENVDYDSFLSYGKDYHWKMNNMNKYIFNRLRDGGALEHTLKPLLTQPDYFGKQMKTPLIDPKREPVPSHSTGKGLLPFERALHLLTYQNKLTVPGAEKVPYDLRKKIDSYIVDLTTDRAAETDRTSYALKELKSLTDSDIKRMQSLNYLHSRRRNITDRIEKNPYSDYWIRQRDSVDALIKAETQNINMNPKLQKTIANKIMKQMVRNLKNGIPVRIRTKSGGVFTATSLKGITYKQLRESIWDSENQKLYGRLIGTPSDDYVQMQSWYEVISKKVGGYGLNPEHFSATEIIDWNKDIQGIRRMIAKSWGGLYGKNAPSYHNSESIANNIQLELKEVYERWNERYNLGSAMLLSSTMPELDFTRMTYSNGRYGVAFFNSPAKEIKHINAVLRFLNSKESLTNLEGVELTGRDFIRRTAQQFTEIYNAFNKPVDIDQGFDNYALFAFDPKFMGQHGKNLLQSRSVDTEAPTDFSRMIDDLNGGGLEDKYKVLDNETIMTILTTNPEQAKAMGLTGNLAYDYISLKRPAVVQGITPSLRALINMDFIPSRALTNTHRNVKISGLNHFYRIKQSEARMLLGSNATGKNLITGKDSYIMRDIASLDNNLNLSREDAKNRTLDQVNQERQQNEGAIC